MLRTNPQTASDMSGFKRPRADSESLSPVTISGSQLSVAPLADPDRLGALPVEIHFMIGKYLELRQLAKLVRSSRYLSSIYADVFQRRIQHIDADKFRECVIRAVRPRKPKYPCRFHQFPQKLWAQVADSKSRREFLEEALHSGNIGAVDIMLPGCKLIKPNWRRFLDATIYKREQLDAFRKGRSWMYFDPASLKAFIDYPEGAARCLETLLRRIGDQYSSKRDVVMGIFSERTIHGDLFDATARLENPEMFKLLIEFTLDYFHLRHDFNKEIHGKGFTFNLKDKVVKLLECNAPVTSEKVMEHLLSLESQLTGSYTVSKEQLEIAAAHNQHKLLALMLGHSSFACENPLSLLEIAAFGRRKTHYDQRCGGVQCLSLVLSKLEADLSIHLTPSYVAQLVESICVGALHTITSRQDQMKEIIADMTSKIKVINEAIEARAAAPSPITYAKSGAIRQATGARTTTPTSITGTGPEMDQAVKEVKSRMMVPFLVIPDTKSEVKVVEELMAGVPATPPSLIIDTKPRIDAIEEAVEPHTIAPSLITNTKFKTEEAVGTRMASRPSMTNAEPEIKATKKTAETPTIATAFITRLSKESLYQPVVRALLDLNKKLKVETKAIILAIRSERKTQMLGKAGYALFINLLYERWDDKISSKHLIRLFRGSGGSGGLKSWLPEEMLVVERIMQRAEYPELKEAFREVIVNAAVPRPSSDSRPPDWVAIEHMWERIKAQRSADEIESLSSFAKNETMRFRGYEWYSPNTFDEPAAAAAAADTSETTPDEVGDIQIHGDVPGLESPPNEMDIGTLISSWS